MYELYENCGLTGAYSYNGDDVALLVARALSALQHRGQESCGAKAISSGSRSRLYKRIGLIRSSLVEPLEEGKINLSGNPAIAHVRYSTKGDTTFSNTHPIRIKSSDTFYIAHNGTIENTYDLEKIVKENGGKADHGMTDTELVGRRLSQLRKKYDWRESFEILNREINGSFCFLILTKSGKIIAARDERGFKPLCYGYHEGTNSYLITSESCALDYVKARLIRYIEPGEIIILDKDGVKIDRFADGQEHAHCSFEWTYFANPSSYIEGKCVQAARSNLGRELAKLYEDEIDADIVIPIPDSGRPGALGFSEWSGIPYREGVLKDRYRKRGSLRSFILPGKRHEIVGEMIIIKEIVKDKKLAVIDDSLVRAITSKLIAKGLREAGAVKVQWFTTFPCIGFPCYMGIDFPTMGELGARNACEMLGYDLESANLDEINHAVAEYIGADFFGYNTVERLRKGVGLDDLCEACSTGKYPLRKSPVFRETREEMKG